MGFIYGKKFPTTIPLTLGGKFFTEEETHDG